MDVTFRDTTLTISCTVTTIYGGGTGPCMRHITVEGIKAGILGRLKTDLDKREGSQTNDEISAISAGAGRGIPQHGCAVPAFYLDETSGAYIDKQAAVVGIVRKAGAKASCVITFTGTDGASVPCRHAPSHGGGFGVLPGGSRGHCRWDRFRHADSS